MNSRNACAAARSLREHLALDLRRELVRRNACAAARSLRANTGGVTDAAEWTSQCVRSRKVAARTCNRLTVR